MDVSLPRELESLVKDRVESGVYADASEVVGAALRHFFHLSETDEIDNAEADRIRSIVMQRMQSIEDGSAEMLDMEVVLADIDRKHFS